MKSYTDVEQSKVLCKILPIKSADMYWDYDVQKHEDYPMIMDNQFDNLCIPAWSLAALLSVINKTYYVTLLHDGVMWNILVIHHDIDKCNHTIHADSPVDACVAMIEKLYELKML